MSDRGIVSFHFGFLRTIPTWRKSQTEWLIVQRGRFGPHWLHRLVWHLAMRLGMIRHERDFTETVRRIDIDRCDDRPLFQQMRRACLLGFDHHGFEPGAIKIICGQTELQELMSTDMGGSSVQFDLAGRWCHSHRRFAISDVPLIVVPGMDGWAVLPADVFSEPERVETLRPKSMPEKVARRALSG